MECIPSVFHIPRSFPVSSALLKQLQCEELEPMFSNEMRVQVPKEKTGLISRTSDERKAREQTVKVAMLLFHKGNHEYKQVRTFMQLTDEP